MRAAAYRTTHDTLRLAELRAAACRAELDCLAAEVKPARWGRFEATCWYFVEAHEGYADIGRKGGRLVTLTPAECSRLGLRGVAA